METKIFMRLIGYKLPGAYLNWNRNWNANRNLDYSNGNGRMAQLARVFVYPYELKLLSY